ncbi:3-dehydroquinate dehydratase [Parasphaerochaeta coccoides DSM 17374]|uniref:Multifunctional fusion protein n=2 Tax=Parasphaerochaeta TaxID=3062336 RepID=F4GLE3_PARC1|nr:3-dehydroquinate dehydratase [Parasphaerochaeta coccoides DSM 17374]
MLCLTLTGRTLLENISQYERNKDWVGAVELRLDYLEESEARLAGSLPEQFPVPMILTCRRESDGGLCTSTERKRLSLMKEVLDRGAFAYVDLEDDLKKTEAEQLARRKGIRIIRSHHDFSGMPADIYARMARILAKGDIPKLAVTPHTVEDVIRLFRIKDEIPGSTEKIVIGMGVLGIPTRILYRKIGSSMMFCCDEAAESVAPGMLSARVLSEVYGADKVDAETEIFGIIGNPVSQSASPLIHNPGFRAIKKNAIYSLFPVDAVRPFFRLADVLDIRGFSVTVPFKRDVIPYLGTISREVKQIGSCNTVVRVKDLWKGINTDYHGFLSQLMPAITSGRVRTALILGAGGAARAVAWALHNHSVKITILNRSAEAARKLAAETMAGWDVLENISEYSGKSDMIVQTTSVGMTPDSDEDPSAGYVFSGKEIAYDLVYKPHQTRFLLRAAEAGCEVIYGAQMLLEQGKLQFEAFTGYHYPHWLEPDW